MKVFKRIPDKIDLHIRKLCNCLSPMQKIVLTVILFALFFLASLYTIAFTAYQIGKKDGKFIQIKRQRVKKLNQDGEVTCSHHLNPRF